MIDRSAKEAQLSGFAAAHLHDIPMRETEEGRRAVISEHRAIRAFVGEPA